MGNCKECKFWNPTSTASGDCQRFPPVVLPIAVKTPEQVKWGHPPRSAEDACGEFLPKPREIQ